MPKFNNVVVLTGAGISAESGLKTFRDQDGLWEKHPIEDVCTPEAFIRNPDLVQAFYNARRAQLQQAQPNSAHVALAEFQRRFEGRLTLITQNVDDLHERAGSANVLHMHGELRQARCTSCERAFEWLDPITFSSTCPFCGRCSLRPHIVWFGEIPLHMQEIEQALWHCDLFVAIGTSGQVYPAAGFVQLACAAGAHTVELNLERTTSGTFSEHVMGPATETVGRFFAQIG